MLVLEILSLVLLASSAAAIPVCHANICMLVDCMFLQTCGVGEVLNSHGGFCGCCPTCVRQLSVGETCSIRLFGASTVTAECGNGLKCDQTTQKCVSSTKRSAEGPCSEDLRKYLSQNPPLLGASKPMCDSEGNYLPKQCRGSGCYCADAEGNNIGYFTEYADGTDHMDCTCAREKAAYMKTGLIGKMFMCDTKGSYSSKQCTGSVCYCADTNGRQLENSRGVPIQDMDKLNC